ncbi:Predicted metal-dependent enzyme [uncultured Clostridium sp.]|nr:Predicted metal-dependent enzyme [uncultured Clostridium sp.]
MYNKVEGYILNLIIFITGVSCMGKKKKTTHYSGIGGQAVLEGVMMKNKDDYAVAIRKPNGEIEVEVDVYRGILHDSALKKIPFIRGIFNFLDSMILGMKTINYSASFYEDEEAEETKLDKALNKVSGGRAEKILMGVTTVASIVIAIAVFMLLPYFLSTLLVQYIRNDSLLAIIEGIIRILIFVIYIVAISLMKDIHRLYQYHGAEHKCINCVENGRPLTIHNVMRSSRIHKRCGTSFMFLVVFVSIILFFFIRVQNSALRVVLRIALVPVIAGISYEIIRLAGRSDNIFVKIISAPGMWLQKLTTKEPDREMAEVAIRSVEAVFDWKSYLKDEFGYEVDDSWLQDEPGEEEE